MGARKELYKLIRSLEGAECRYFRLFIAQQPKSRKKQYEKVFNAIRNSRSDDEKELKKSLAGESFIHRLPAIKNYLFSILMKCLRQFHGGKIPEMKLQDLIQDAYLLQEKGLFILSGKLLRKARKIAWKHERFYHFLEVIRLESILVEQKYAFSEWGKLQKEEADFLDILKNKNEYWELFVRATLLHQEEPKLRSASARAESDELLRQPLLANESSAISTQAKIYFFQTQSMLTYSMGDYEKSLDIQKKYIAMLEKHPVLIKVRPAVYILAVYGLHTSQFELHRYHELVMTGEKLRRLLQNFEKSLSEKMCANLYRQIYHTECSSCILCGKFLQGLSVVPEIEVFINKSGGVQSNEYFIVLYYDIAYLYFGSGDYSKSLRWVNRILDETRLTFALDEMIHTRLLYLILHLELGNFDLLDYAVRTTRTLLRKRKRLYTFERILLGFVRKYFRVGTSKQEQAVAFSDLRKEFLKIISDPAEKKVLVYFDYFSWLESKITGKTFAEIVKEKAARGNGS